MGKLWRWLTGEPQISNRAKCPACGHRENGIRFDPERKLIVHICHICRAEWGELPVLPAEAWIK